MWYEIWKGREKKFGKRCIWTRIDRVKNTAAGESVKIRPGRPAS